MFREGFMNIFNSFLKVTYDWGSQFFATEDKTMEEIPIFGADEWRTYLKLDVDAPEIPKRIQELLPVNCPFWPDKLIKETHFLCLTPKNINLEKLYELTGLKSSSPIFKEVNDVIMETHWILITKKPIPGSESLPFKEKNNLVLKNGYEIPSILEAAVAIVSAKFLNNTILYPKVRQFTVCKEMYNECPLAIGSDSNVPFSIYTNDWQEINGVAGVIR